jgi:hypothetical protein
VNIIKLGERYINMDTVNEIEFTERGCAKLYLNMLMWSGEGGGVFGTDGRESIQISGEDVRHLRTWLDQHSADAARFAEIVGVCTSHPSQSDAGV